MKRAAAAEAKANAKKAETEVAPEVVLEAGGLCATTATVMSEVVMLLMPNAAAFEFTTATAAVLKSLTNWLLVPVF